MKRKTIAGLIAIVAIVVVAMLAGCVEEEPTVSDIYVSDETAIYTVRTALSDQGFRSVIIQVADGRDKGGVKALMVSYRSTALSEGDLAYETGCILGAYIGVVEAGGDFDELGVVVGDGSGNAIGMWYCSKDWTNEYINGKISRDALLVKVLGSMTPL